jgi:hypothetical protein
MDLVHQKRMRITTGAENYEIFDSGTVITFKNEPLKFHLTDDMMVTMLFESNRNESGNNLSFNVRSNNELVMTLLNFNSTLGSGNAEPIPLAKIDNKQLYINFNIQAVGENAKIVTYTWYLREEVENG